MRATPIGACAPTPIAKSAPSCPTPSHDDGLGSCVALDACAPSFTLDSSGRCARWIELPPLPTAVAGATATLLGDGRVLVAGGSIVDAAGEAEPTNLAAVIAPAGDSFVPGAMIEARDRHAAAHGNGAVLVVGGFNRTAFPDTVEVYVPVERKFTPAGFDSDILPSAAVDDRGRIWIVGGHTKVFDPATLDLTDEVDPPEQHSTGHLVSIPGAHSALLFGGGVTFSDGSELLQTQVDILDTSAGTWSLLADGGPALLRTDAAVGVLGDGRVVVAGGLVDGKANAAAFFLDAAARTIDPAPPLPVGIGLACAASSGGSVVVAGGLVDGTGVTDRSFVYEPDGTLTSLPPLPSARARAACVTLADGRVLVAGGENADGSVADVAILERGLR